MKPILKGIPKKKSGGRKRLHDFSTLQINEGVETTVSGAVCARNYGRLCGKIFTQRLKDGKWFIFRKK